jgi:hypothetical protein
MAKDSSFNIDDKKKSYWKYEKPERLHQDSTKCVEITEADAAEEAEDTAVAEEEEDSKAPNQQVQVHQDLN